MASTVDTIIGKKNESGDKNNVANKRNDFDRSSALFGDVAEVGNSLYNSSNVVRRETKESIMDKLSEMI